MAASESPEDLEQAHLHLPEFGDMPRMPFAESKAASESLLHHIYPAKMIAYTSPAQWYSLCRLFDRLPKELMTFNLPISDPYILPFQKLSDSIPDCLNLRFITALSLRPYQIRSFDVVDDSAVDAISKLKSLRALDMSETRISSNGIRKLAASCIGSANCEFTEWSGPQKLQILILGGCWAIDGSVSGHLSKFTLLQYIDLRGTKCNESIIQQLPSGFHTTLPPPFLTTTTTSTSTSTTSFPLSASAASVARLLHEYNNRHSPALSVPELMILNIDHLDYPAPKRLRHSNEPREIFSERYYCVISPNGNMRMGDADALVAAEERPANHEKPLPNAIYDAAMGMAVMPKKRRDDIADSKPVSRWMNMDCSPSASFYKTGPLDRRQCEDIEKIRPWEKSEDKLLFFRAELPSPAVTVNLKPAYTTVTSVTPSSVKARKIDGARQRLAANLLCSLSPSPPTASPCSPSQKPLPSSQNPFRIKAGAPAPGTFKGPGKLRGGRF